MYFVPCSFLLTVVINFVFHISELVISRSEDSVLQYTRDSFDLMVKFVSNIIKTHLLNLIDLTYR